jgi:hypothetical protein
MGCYNAMAMGFGFKLGFNSLQKVAVIAFNGG